MFDPIKRRLRTIGWLYRINAALRCWQTKRAYRRTVRYYQDRPAATSSPRPLTLVWRRESRPLRIFFLGTDEQQDKSGFVQALERLGEVRAFTRSDGTWGQNDPAPYALRRARNSQRLWEQISGLAAQGWVPDLLIAQTWACLIEPAMLGRLRATFGIYVINVAMDDRHQYWGRRVEGQWDGTYPLIPHVDLTLTAAPEAVEWYRKEGGAALYFPEASDPSIFHPMPALPKEHAVCFVGSRYGVRARIVDALTRAGIQVAAYGNGWRQGRIAIEEVPRLFARSKIILGVSAIGQCPDFVGLKMRDFDAPMSGSCYLTQDNPDLRGLYEVGREILTYRSVEDCVHLVRQYLRDDEAREAIARAGLARAQREHTWDRRFADLMAYLERL